MTMPISERRKIENEMIFRRTNEKVGIKLDELDVMHTAEGNEDLVWDNDTLLHFMCECSDENCDARILIKLSTYRRIHLNRDSFIIKLKHQVESIEKVVFTETDYSVVEKNNSTTDPGKTLNKTSVDNS